MKKAMHLVRVLGFVLAALFAQAAPAAAQYTELNASGTIDALGDSVVLAIRGRPGVAVRLTNGTTFSGVIQVEVSSDGGTTWDERLIINGDNLVAGDFLPHAVEAIREYSVPINPANTHVRVKPLSYTSGSTVVTIRANDQADPALASGMFGFQTIPTTLDGANDAVEVTVWGSSVGFAIETNNLVGTLTVEGNPYSHGNEAAWVGATFFAGSTWQVGALGWAVSSAAEQSIIVAHTAGHQRYRLRVSAYTSGSAVAHGRTARAIETTLPLTGGLNDEAVPFLVTQVGGGARTNEPTAVAAGDLVRVLQDVLGKQVFLPYALGADFLSATATETTAGTNTTIIAAQGAGVRIYVTGCVFANSSATVTEALLKDGTTTVSTITVPADNTHTVTFPTPLRLTANTALTFDIAASVTSMIATCTGYKSAA